MTSHLPEYEEYEARVTASRQAFARHPAIRVLSDQRIDAPLFAQWHYRYVLHGVHVTRDMERVISTAGTRLRALGLEQVGAGLVKHARGETGHDRLMADDARAMGKSIAENGGVPLDTEAILADAPALRSARRYTEFFDRLSEGELPQGTVAALYEMEQLSAGVAIDLMANCRRTIGDDRTCYTFLDEHVVVDMGHIALDRRLLVSVLEAQPELLPELVQAGGDVLSCYAEFMGECLERARADLAAA